MVHPKTLVIIEGRRDQAVERLKNAFAESELEVEELERRLELVESAESIAGVELAVKDLPAVSPVQTTALATVSRPDSVFAMMSGATRSGPFAVPPVLSATAVWGGIKLDFSEADFSGGAHELNCRAIMGGIEILVPAHVRVECTGAALMGSFVNRAVVPESADAPVLRIHGFAVWGGVSVANRSWRDEARSLRREARRRRHGARRLRRHHH